MRPYGVSDREEAPEAARQDFPQPAAISSARLVAAGVTGVAGVVAFAVFFFVRSYPWPLALWSAAAVAALAFFTINAARRLREEFRPR